MAGVELQALVAYLAGPGADVVFGPVSCVSSLPRPNRMRGGPAGHGDPRRAAPGISTPSSGPAAVGVVGFGWLGSRKDLWAGVNRPGLAAHAPPVGGAGVDPSGGPVLHREGLDPTGRRHRDGHGFRRHRSTSRKAAGLPRPGQGTGSEAVMLGRRAASLISQRPTCAFGATRRSGILILLFAVGSVLRYTRRPERDTEPSEHRARLGT
jgi:hypothetical protein